MNGYNLAYAASFRTDGTYRPVEEMHLVLLGDVLDVIRSRAWLADADRVRPWSDVEEPAFGQKIDAITRATLAHNADSLAVLKSISCGRKVTVPETVRPRSESNAEAEPQRERRVPVKVHVHY